jgi:hypothetical protein
MAVETVKTADKALAKIVITLGDGDSHELVLNGAGAILSAAADVTVKVTTMGDVDLDLAGLNASNVTIPEGFKSVTVTDVGDGTTVTAYYTKNAGN